MVATNNARRKDRKTPCFKITKVRKHRQSYVVHGREGAWYGTTWEVHSAAFGNGMIDKDKAVSIARNRVFGVAL